MTSYQIYFLNNELDRIDKQKDFIKRKMRKDPENKMYQLIYDDLLEEEEEKEKAMKYRIL